VSDWIEHGLELPQYAVKFRENAITVRLHCFMAFLRSYHANHGFEHSSTNVHLLSADR
jgi:hypothetical protein